MIYPPNISVIFHFASGKICKICRAWPMTCHQLPQWEALFAAKYLQIPAVGLWTFAGPGSLVGIVNMFLTQSGGMEPAEVFRQVESFEPMLESIRRFKENYGFFAVNMHCFQRVFLEVSFLMFFMQAF